MAASRKKPAQRSGIFDGFARWICNAAGRPAAFAGAILVIVGWIATGPIFGYSDTWQLIINTGTTIITFLMVFLIQHSQNRDSRALHLKLDELIRASKPARNALLDLDDLSEEELEDLHSRYVNMAAHARRHLDKRGSRRSHPARAAAGR